MERDCDEQSQPPRGPRAWARLEENPADEGEEEHPEGTHTAHSFTRLEESDPTESGLGTGSGG